MPRDAHSGARTLVLLRDYWESVDRGDVVSLSRAYAPGGSFCADGPRRPKGGPGPAEAARGVLRVRRSAEGGTRAHRLAFVLVGPRRAVSVVVAAPAGGASAQLVSLDPRTRRIQRDEHFLGGPATAGPESLPKPLRAVLDGASPIVALERRDRREAGNLYALRRFYERLRRGEAARAREAFGPDAEAIELDDGRRAAGATFVDGFAGARVEPRRWLAAGDAVAVLHRATGESVEGVSAAPRRELCVFHLADRLVREVWRVREAALGAL